MNFFRIKNLSEWWTKTFMHRLLGNQIFLYGLYCTLTVNLLTQQAIYQPFKGCSISKENKYFFRNPSERGLNYDNIVIKKNGVTLRGWFIKQEDPLTSPTIVFFHENIGNLGQRLEYLQRYFNCVKCNIVIVAYRGYDESTGIPHQRGIQKDAIAITEYVFQELNIDKTQVFAHGKSLGGAVASYAFYKTQEQNPSYRGLIVENTFTSYLDVIPNLFQVLELTCAFQITNIWNAQGCIAKIKNPILFISSGKDKFVTPRNMLELRNSAQNCKKIYEHHIPEGDHFNGWEIDPADYFNSILKFMKEVTN